VHLCYGYYAMFLSDIYYMQYSAACHLGKSEARCNQLYLRWQRQLDKENKFCVYNKRVLVW
jgi:hypothetical protein